MVVASLIRWWFVDGWLEQLRHVRWAFIRMADRFSIGLLIKTLFNPFRQIAADESARGAGGMFNVMIDKLISRLIGSVVRTATIIAGVITLTALLVISLVRIVLWLLLPVMPLVGIVLMLTVGAPWTII